MKIILTTSSLIIILFLFLGILLYYVENYFPPAPYIDTTFTDNYSWEKCEKIESGMTKNKVYQIIGKTFEKGIKHEQGGKIKSGEEMNGLFCDIYSKDNTFPWWDFAWISMNICYDESGKVAGKNERISYN